MDLAGELQVLEVGLEVAEVVHGGSLLAAAWLITAPDVVGSLEVQFGGLLAGGGSVAGLMVQPRLDFKYFKL